MPNEQMPVNIRRITQNGFAFMTVPFCEVKNDDYIVDKDQYAYGDAHASCDASYDGWLIHTRNGDALFPEDFTGSTAQSSNEEIQNIYETIESALTLAGYEVLAHPYSGLLIYGNGELYNYRLDLSMEAK